MLQRQLVRECDQGGSSTSFRLVRTLPIAALLAVQLCSTLQNKLAVYSRMLQHDGRLTLHASGGPADPPALSGQLIMLHCCNPARWQVATY
jgi:hypothetical protein